MYTSTTKAKLKTAGVMFAGIMTLAVVTNIGLVKGVQNLWKQEGQVVKLVNGADRTLNIEGDLIVAGTQTFTGAPTFNGLLTLNAGLVKSNTNATSTTATTYTLVPDDIVGYTSMLMTPNVGTLTITPFASSTATTYLPVAGDRDDFCIFNATTTAGVLITFASGSSFDIATSSPSGLSIKAGEWGCLDIMREPETASTFDFGAILDVGSE